MSERFCTYKSIGIQTSISIIPGIITFIIDIEKADILPYIYAFIDTYAYLLLRLHT